VSSEKEPDNESAEHDVLLLAVSGALRAGLCPGGFRPQTRVLALVETAD